MSLIEQLQPASYKGVSFLVMVSSTSGGRKDVKHVYPNSDGQTIEDLGLSPRVFTLTCIVTGDDDYIQKRDRFISVLEQGGPGTLIHPFYGRLDDYVARGNYSLEERITDLGEARFTVVFELSNIDGPPIKSQNTLSLIDNANQAIVSGTQNEIAENYQVTPGFTGNFGAAKNKLNSVIDSFNENTSLFQASADKINAFNQELNTFSAKVNSLVQNPLELSTSITNLFNTVDGLYVNVANTVAVLGGFFSFGDNDSEIITTTAGLEERKNNNDIVNATVQTLALSYSYFNTAQIDFETVNEIDTAANALEQQYRKVINLEGLSDAIKNDLTDLRTILQGFFNDQRVIARQVIEVDTYKTSARLLSYKYYGDSSEGETILILNNVKQDVNFIEGKVKILTA